MWLIKVLTCGTCCAGQILRLIKMLEKRSRGTLTVVLILSRSVFLLIFTAHSMGCFFTMLANAEDQELNWLSAYMAQTGGVWDPTDDATLSDRYVTALYWAIVTVRPPPPLPPSLPHPTARAWCGRRSRSK